MVFAGAVHTAVYILTNMDKYFLESLVGKRSVSSHIKYDYGNRIQKKIKSNKLTHEQKPPRPYPRPPKILLNCKFKVQISDGCLERKFITYREIFKFGAKAT